ncbi:HAMP domain-containing sensor histidine kinase [Kribbella albertanoniae]|uniref:histidine kinase n=1 Tax=Kribbella albertanoniae TaxID=1266829 RepID=A0A4R4Q4U0_9ACTN|nr:HAMP domain-containing sensor histidine kinase [Kribbella albertanoniae]TDC29959.1 HAMP domain-containing histidine kinase [Kribbella albertanoniae]
MKSWTLRARLTILYGGLFLVAGAVLLGVTYLLVQNSLATQLDGPTDARIAALRVSAVGASGRDVDQLVAEIQRQQQEVRSAAGRALLTQGGIALLGVGLLAGASGWLLAGRALRPVQRIRETAQRIAADGTGNGLHERIALVGADDDVKQLADSFDEMLDRLDRSFDGQRRFVANASHELRTPLAMNRVLVDVALGEPGVPDQTKELGASLLAVNRRHEQLIEGLLLLAESESAAFDTQPVDLAAIAAEVVEATSTELTLSTTLGAASTIGDPVLLGRLVENLVENAVRYNVPGGSVDVRTTRGPEQVVLTVTNTGPVVLDSEVEALFEPFRRARVRTEQRGSGLGLSIVRAVAKAHGGEAVAQANPDGGLTVRVSLPTT